MQDPLDHIAEPTKHALDALGVITVIGTLAQFLPQLSALFSLVWFAVRIWETETVRGWTGRQK